MRARNERSEQAERHRQLRREIIAAHPEVRALAGKNAYGVLCALVVLAVHWSILAAVSGSNVLIVFLVALCAGQLCIHSAGALIHESAHRLVLADRHGKRAFDLLLEVITTSFGRQLIYHHEHLSSHHVHLGDYERDYEHEDLCRYAARKRLRARAPHLQRALVMAELLLHLLPLGFLGSDAILLPFYRRGSGLATRDRARHIGATAPIRSERWLFFATSVSVLAFLGVTFGPLGALYQVWSLSLFLGKAGVTNLGQSLSEHPGDDALRPTRSTYWWGNWILFNTGYHDEHHTFPNVPWSRLPRLKALAPEVFAHAGGPSYAAYWWTHVREGFSPSRRNALQDQDPSARCGTSRSNQSGVP